VGIPGLIMAIWVRTLKEPTRGISEGLVTKAHPAPFRVLGKELTAIIPPFNLLAIKDTPGELKTNAIGLLAIIAGAWLLIALTGSIAQWVTTGFGVYVTFSWIQSLKIRDPATYAMMFQSKAFVYTLLAFPLTAFMGYGAGFWIAPLLLRIHEVGAAEVGLYLGLGAAMGGFIGITAGGFLADYLKRQFPSGRLVLGYIVVIGSTPLLFILLTTDSLVTAYWVNFLLTAFSACGGGVPPSTAADLVMPRMRATAGAYYILVNTFLGLALGPYFMGQFSDMFFATGMNDADSLRWAMGVSMLTFIPALFFFYLAQKHLPAEEASRLERARKLGEKLDD
jgi:hypothetical protein